MYTMSHDRPDTPDLTVTHPRYHASTEGRRHAIHGIHVHREFQLSRRRTAGVQSTAERAAHVTFAGVRRGTASLQSMPKHAMPHV
jgi:hypothetical protein